MKRVFIFITMLISIAVLSACNSLKVQTCSPIITMSTTIEVTFYNVDDYQTHYNEIKKIYHEIDRVSSYYESNDNNSIYDLNLNRTIAASDLLYDLLITANSLSNDIDSYFNIYMGRISELWKEAISNNTAVDLSIIESELDIMNNTHLNFDEKTITLVGDGNIDLGGFAKGYATQKAKEYLDSVGVDSFLINAGSSNVVFGNKNNDVFRIALSKPYSKGNITIIEGTNMAIGSSSGKYQNTVIDGIRYHHIIDPKTGYPADYFDNVNVIANDSALCDMYSTALFSMPLENAIEFAEKNDIEIILFKDDEIVYYSEGLKL